MTTKNKGNVVAKMMSGLIALALIVGVSVGLSSCGEPAETATPQAVLESYVDAINNNDFAKALSFVKDTGGIEADKIVPIDTSKPIDKPLVISTGYDEKADKVNLKFELNGSDEDISFIKTDSGYQLAKSYLIETNDNLREIKYKGESYAQPIIGVNENNNYPFWTEFTVVLANGQDTNQYNASIRNNIPEAILKFKGNEILKEFELSGLTFGRSKYGNSSPSWILDKDKYEDDKIELADSVTPEQFAKATKNSRNGECKNVDFQPSDFSSLHFRSKGEILSILKGEVREDYFAEMDKNSSCNFFLDEKVDGLLRAR